MALASHQKSIGVNRNHQNKSMSRICHGGVTSYFDPLGHVSSLSLLRARLGVCMPQRPYNQWLCPCYGWGFALDQSITEQSSFIDLWDHSFECLIIRQQLFFTLCSFEFLLMFFDSYAGISLLDKINWVVTWLIARQDVVLRLRSLDVVVFSQISVSSMWQIDSYLHLTEDQNPILI